MRKKVPGLYGDERRHWVSDGFPVRTIFGYDSLGSDISPFLLLNYAGPYDVDPTKRRCGVGKHPHRGFETVTLVFDGEVEHRDSAGNGGVIGPGDVQWMTAGGSIFHEEHHSAAFAKSGDRFRMARLWVNLPVAAKTTAGSYQSLSKGNIPSVALPKGVGKARVIAGEYRNVKGPVRTSTSINIWDLPLKAGGELSLDLPVGYTTMIFVLTGSLTVQDSYSAAEAAMVLLDRQGSVVSIEAEGEATLLILTGEPIHEPIVGDGPFVMASAAEIRRTYEDFKPGRLTATH